MTPIRQGIGMLCLLWSLVPSIAFTQTGDTIHKKRVLIPGDPTTNAQAIDLMLGRWATFLEDEGWSIQSIVPGRAMKGESHIMIDPVAPSQHEVEIVCHVRPRGARALCLSLISRFMTPLERKDMP